MGGRDRRGSKRGRPGPDSHKTPVVALVERGTGRVKAMPMPRITSENLRAALNEHVSTDTRIMTDELNAYGAATQDYRGHEAVIHGKHKYVRGEAHTNTVEGFFSLLMRGVNGVYHHVSRGHLGRYCDEFAFRYDNRKVSGRRYWLPEPRASGSPTSGQRELSVN